jgi:hypothetical protein
VRLLLILAACLGVASAQDTESNMACVERLQMPLYPGLAHQARISGTVTAAVSIPAEGAVRIDAKGHRLLAPYVEQAIRASTFRKACAGKSVKLIFNFSFDEDRYKAVSFGYPNQFWITVPHPVIERAP